MMSHPRTCRPRPGPFLPASVRHRSDGWTPQRQARFLGMLAQTGSVAAAARAVGLTRQTAYRLRQRPGAESFARAWDRALGHVTTPSRKVTPAEVLRRATEDLLWPVVHRGHFKQVAVKHDNKALLRLLGQRRQAAPGGLGLPPADFKKSPGGVTCADALTPAPHPPTAPPVCRAQGAQSGPPLAPSPVEGRLPVTLAGVGL